MYKKNTEKAQGHLRAAPASSLCHDRFFFSSYFVRRESFCQSSELASSSEGPKMNVTRTYAHKRTQTHTDAHRRTQTHTAGLCFNFNFKYIFNFNFNFNFEDHCFRVHPQACCWSLLSKALATSLNNDD